MRKADREAAEALARLTLSVRCPQCGAGIGSMCKPGLHQRRTARALKWAAKRKGKQ